MRGLELRVPPPIVMLVSAGAMWLLAAALPALRLDASGRGNLAAILAVSGVLISIAGAVQVRRAGTTVNPMRPGEASALVTGGVYHFTRNPMYLGLAVVLLGWAVYLAHPLAFLVLPLFVGYLNRFQIVPEERALESKFGPNFRAYCQRVRRWL